MEKLLKLSKMSPIEEQLDVSLLRFRRYRRGFRRKKSVGCMGELYSYKEGKKKEGERRRQDKRGATSYMGHEAARVSNLKQDATVKFQVMTRIEHSSRISDAYLSIHRR